MSLLEDSMREDIKSLTQQISELRIALKEARYIVYHSDNYLITGDEDQLSSDLLTTINNALGET